VLMSWCPDDVKVRSKFIHAASVEGMKKAITGISAFVQVSVHPVEICDPTYAVQHN
jgi:cofilin